jgi:hypothetical protein
VFLELQTKPKINRNRTSFSLFRFEPKKKIIYLFRRHPNAYCDSTIHLFNGACSMIFEWDICLEFVRNKVKDQSCLTLLKARVETKVFVFIFSRKLSLFASKHDKKSQKWWQIYQQVAKIGDSMLKNFHLSQTINKISRSFAIFLLRKVKVFAKSENENFSFQLYWKPVSVHAITWNCSPAHENNVNMCILGTSAQRL